MVRSLGAIVAIALLSLSTTASAQRPPPPPARTAPAAPADEGADEAPPSGERDALREELREELDRRIEALREELRDEARAAATSAGAASEWDEEWEDVRPKLDFLELDGYLRTRMDVFHNFDMNTGVDPAGYPVFARGAFDPEGDTIAGANMRLRVDPTLNVSEEIRVRSQLDLLDNLVLGSTPGGGFGLSGGRSLYAFDSEGQDTPRFGYNSISDSIEVKRAWAEVRTPVGELRFGRMPTDFGLGMMWNDGNCLDCDHGDTVDRFSFSVKIADHVITPAIDFLSEGPTSGDLVVDVPTAQPFDRTQIDDGRDYVLTILRRDTPEDIRSMRAAGRELFLNYGLYFVYREQGWDAPDFHAGGGSTHGNAGGGSVAGGEGVDDGAELNREAFVPRDAWAVMPDVWFRLLYKSLRLELELGTVYGEIGSRAVAGGAGADAPEVSQSLDLSQVGGVLQSELKLADDRLSLGLEIGFATGDSSPGFGNFPGRGGGASEFPSRGSWEGAQFECLQPACADDSIDNFRFDRDYRVDLILFREILGGVTDATYVKPSVGYDISEGLGLDLAIIYSQVNSSGTTPTRERPLGIEIDAAVNYLSDDGFVASLAYGVLFPLSGLDQLENPANPAAGTIGAETAQTVRALFGIVY